MNNKKNYSISIQIPENINVKKSNNIVVFSGPLGSTRINLKKIDPLGYGAIQVNLKNINILATSKAYLGLLKKLISNKIHGINRGFLIYLKITGIGYRASLEKNSLLLKLGYSHDIIYNIPTSVKIFLLDPTSICIFGVDKNQVTQIASNLRSLRKPSVYRGKGIKLLTEKIYLKTGKRK